MQAFFQNKNILIGITGSIAAYKIPKLIDLLTQLGANVQVVLTDHAKHFVTPLALQALGATVVRSDLFDPQAERAMSHIQLAKWCDCFLIAPCSANTLSALSVGLANNLLTTLSLVTKSPIVLAPAMNQAMWESLVIQAHVKKITQQGMHFIGPIEGTQACGDLGIGRMMDIELILLHLISVFLPKPLKGKKVLVSAGGTREPIDPVRFIGNRSSGKMGFSMANAAVHLGAKVHLIKGYVDQTLFHIAQKESFVKTAFEMEQVVMSALDDVDIFVSVAAVSDFRPDSYSKDKIKKNQAVWKMNLIQNSDILSKAKRNFPDTLSIGFAAETNVKQADQKMQNKGIDALIVNEVSCEKGFEVDENSVDVLLKDQMIHLSQMPKSVLAQQIWQVLIQHMKSLF